MMFFIGFFAGIATVFIWMTADAVIDQRRREREYQEHFKQVANAVGDEA